jgi:hypothetical protein
MNLLDIRTILIGGVISDAICALVISFMCHKSGAFKKRTAPTTSSRLKRGRPCPKKSAIPPFSTPPLAW